MMEFFNSIPLTRERFESNLTLPVETLENLKYENLEYVNMESCHLTSRSEVSRLQ